MTTVSQRNTIAVTALITSVLVYSMTRYGHIVFRFRHFDAFDLTRFGKPYPGRCRNQAWIYEMHPWSDLKGFYSQGAQDLYLERIFSVIGSLNRSFVEFGFNEPTYTAGGSGANTRLLYEKGWRGLLLDGDHENLEINLRKHYLFASNIARIFAENHVPKDLDYLSIDMDSHDLWVFRAILQAGYRPRVVTTEFNSNYPLSIAVSVIDPTLLGNGSVPPGFSVDPYHCAWGASALALGKVARQYDYVLIGRVGKLDLVWLRADLLEKCHLVPEFEWFFRNVAMGELIHTRQKSLEFVEKIVEYDSFTSTGDFNASAKAARVLLKTLDLACFRNIYESL